MGNNPINYLDSFGEGPLSVKTCHLALGAIQAYLTKKLYELVMESYRLQDQLGEARKALSAELKRDAECRDTKKVEYLMRVVGEKERAVAAAIEARQKARETFRAFIVRLPGRMLVCIVLTYLTPL